MVCVFIALWSVGNQEADEHEGIVSDLASASDIEKNSRIIETVFGHVLVRLNELPLDPYSIHFPPSSPEHLREPPQKIPGLDLWLDDTVRNPRSIVPLFGRFLYGTNYSECRGTSSLSDKLLHTVPTKTITDICISSSRCVIYNSSNRLYLPARS